MMPLIHIQSVQTTTYSEVTAIHLSVSASKKLLIQKVPTMYNWFEAYNLCQCIKKLLIVSCLS